MIENVINDSWILVPVVVVFIYLIVTKKQY